MLHQSNMYELEIHISHATRERPMQALGLTNQ